MRIHSALTVTLLTGALFLSACATAQAEEGKARPRVPRVTVTGKIDFQKDLGGYCVRGENPADEYIIDNPDPVALKKLMESGRTLTIVGTLPRGSYFLVIEKIDGKAYRGKKRPPDR